GRDDTAEVLVEAPQDRLECLRKVLEIDRFLVVLRAVAIGNVTRPPAVLFLSCGRRSVTVGQRERLDWSVGDFSCERGREALVDAAAEEEPDRDVPHQSALNRPP